MDVSNPAVIALSPGMAGVLRVLAGADAAFTMRTIARLAGVSHTRTRQVVDRLVRHGLVSAEEQGPSRLCRLNWAHLAAEPLVALVQLRSRMLHAVRSEIEDWSVRPEHASLFGSAARGDGGPESDLDVLVIRPRSFVDDSEDWSEQLSVSGARIQAATGNDVAWFDLARADLQRAVRQKEAIVDEWRRDSVHLVGTELRHVLKEGQ